MMPLYVYQCECGVRFEKSGHMKDHDKPVKCPECGELAPRFVPGEVSGVMNHPVTGPGPQNTGTSKDVDYDRRLQFLKPFGFFDYVRLQMAALCVVSDSGSITEEASLLNLPAVTLRNAHERPEGMDVGTLVMAGLKKERVLDAVRVVIDQHDRNERVMNAVEDYEGGPVSKQVLRVVLSYTDYINRTVWSK